ncbi:hypothetical protein LXL04_005273 [Taraxacum kok-saghyz]
MEGDRRADAGFESRVRYGHSKSEIGVTEDAGSGIDILSNTLCATGSNQFLSGCNCRGSDCICLFLVILLTSCLEIP